MLQAILIRVLPKLILAALERWGWMRAGAERERRKAAEDAAQRTDKGRQGAAQAQQDLKGGKTPEQIVRDNDGKW